ncbi:hypothetical protein SK128_023619, partial [Halocaridina rubra]
TINKSDLFETRLRVGVSASESSTANAVSTASVTQNISVDVISKIDQLLHRQSAVEEQLRSAKKSVYLTLVVMILILVIIYMTMNNMTSNLLMYSTAVHKSLQGTNQHEHPDL